MKNIFSVFTKVNEKIDEQLYKYRYNKLVQRLVYGGVLLFFIGATIFLLASRSEVTHSKDSNAKSQVSTTVSNDTQVNNQDTSVKQLEQPSGWTDDHKDVPTFSHTFTGAVTTAYAYDALLPQMGGWNIPTLSRHLKSIMDFSVLQDEFKDYDDAATKMIDKTRTGLQVPLGAIDRGEANVSWEAVMYKPLEVTNDRVHLYIMDNNEKTYYNGDKDTSVQIKEYDMHWVDNRWVVFSLIANEKVSIDYAKTMMDKDSGHIMPNSDQVKQAGWKIIGG